MYYSKDRKKIEIITKNKNFDIECYIGRGWDNYSIHLIEPLINIINKNNLIVENNFKLKKYKCVKFKNNKKKIKLNVYKTKRTLFSELKLIKK